ncbi:MAG: hypothetical protein R3B55_01730 [Candidatus Paceibacterota bacterium]
MSTFNNYLSGQKEAVRIADEVLGGEKGKLFTKAILARFTDLKKVSVEQVREFLTVDWAGAMAKLTDDKADLQKDY